LGCHRGNKEDAPLKQDLTGGVDGERTPKLNK
jgi:hypothetical protein